MMILRGARIIDPSSRINQVGDILVSEGKIIKVGEDLLLDAPLIARAKGEKLETIDCTGLVAAPGFVDTHVHFRDPGLTYKEDIQSGALAGAAGGFTTVIMMANTKPVVDSEESVLYAQKEGRKAPIRVKTCATITKGMIGKELVDMKLLKDAGAVGFTDDGLPIMGEDLVKEAMHNGRVLKMPLSFHEEDHVYITEPGVNAGEVAKKMGLTGADRLAESSMVERDCKLAKDTGAAIVIQHISAKESVEFVRKAKKSGARVYAEATPHHFSLTEEAVLQYKTLAKMNPPLREEADRLAIIEGLQDGTIDVIATDHAPHSKEEKDREFVKAPSGIIGLETALSLGIMNLVKPGYLSLSQLVARMSTEPAKIYDLDAGTLKEDAPADIVLFDPKKEWTYDRSYSKSSNSPWLHQKLRGKVVMTICGGRIVYREE
jgi:dihydroorotase, multifunctional complex type